LILSELKNLKLISRVGVGLDNVDMIEAKKLGIKILNTPEEPSFGVAEYCLGIFIYFLRDIHLSNLRLKEKNWKRNMSLSLKDAKISLVGGGRVSKKLMNLLINCGAENIFVTDVADLSLDSDWKKEEVKIVDIKDMYDSDIISFHLPLTEKTKNLVDSEFIQKLTNCPFLVNTSRGEIFDEDSIIKAIESNKVSSVAIDVFKEEPYTGKLLDSNKIITTPHIASTSRSVRYNMELASCKNLINFFKNYEK
jgi:Phosphoglycerate dehydrogenase and related dehydrogenases